MRTSLARVAHWLRGFQHEVCPAENAARRDVAIAALSIETQTQMGKIRHLRSAMTFHKN